jgi:V/A-type H+/Na+-transporting ATPase subunit I
MAIVKMNKFTLLAFESQKNKLMEALQNFEEVHFINLQDESILEKNELYRDLRKDSPDEKRSHYEEIVSKLRFAIDFIEPYTEKKSMLKSLKEGKKGFSSKQIENYINEKDWGPVYEKLKEKELNINTLKNEKIKYETEVLSILPWSNFDGSFEDLKKLKLTSYFLGTIPIQYEESFLGELNADSDLYWEVINRTNQDMNMFILVSKAKAENTSDLIKKYGFSSFQWHYDGIPKDLLDKFKEKISDIDNEIERIIKSIKNYENKIEILQVAYDYYSNEIIKLDASNNFLKTAKVVAISGWCAQENIGRLEEVINHTLGEDYIVNFYEVSDEDMEEVPVKLQNNKFVSPFESITEMYSLPKYNEIDPTPLLAPFYFLFFGMMVADAGYGVVLLIISVIALRLFKLEASMKKFIEFFFYLSISTTLFGAAYGSYFGDAIKIPGIINPNKDITTVLILSLAFGIVHIFFGLGIKAYVMIRDGQYLNALYDVGSWVLTLVGAGLFGAGSMIGLPTAVIEVAKYAMFAGMLLIVITQGRYAKSFGAKMGSGLYALYGITSYIGDLVSYTRLMALGLAGGSIAGALNLIIKFFPGISVYIIGPIFFILAQIFNLLLSLLGAYVHTCRLQYVEFFSKFYEGGGKPFKPFKPLNKYIELKKD